MVESSIRCQCSVNDVQERKYIAGKVEVALEVVTCPLIAPTWAISFVVIDLVAAVLSV